MKKFNVECKGMKDEFLDNYVGDYITAETAEEAIEAAIDYLMDKIIENGCECERKGDEIMIYENEKIVDMCTDFSAKEIEE